jgi:acetylserotonin N-methyltransferase
MNDPAPILELIDAFRRSKTMFTAVSVGIFDGKRPPGAAMDRLLDACVSLGLLRKQADEYINTPVADEYLARSSPRTLSGYVRNSNDALYRLWEHLEEAVIEGTNRWEQTFGPGGTLFTHFFRTPEAQRDFLMGMHGFGMLSSPAVIAAFDLSRFTSFVDLGGATGHLALAAIEKYPAMKATVFDLPSVMEVAKEHTGDRVMLVAGDFFVDPLPASDLYAVSRILHDWTEAKIVALLDKIFAVLPEGGGLLIAEKLLQEDRSGSVTTHMQSLNMLVCTEGRERTLSEYSALLRGAGFQEIKGHVTGAPLDAVLALKTRS